MNLTAISNPREKTAQIASNVLPPLIGSGLITARRSGNIVELIFTVIANTEGETGLMATIPVGWRPLTTVFSAVLADRDGKGQQIMMDIEVGGNIVIHRAAAAPGRCYGRITYITGEAPPPLLSKFFAQVARLVGWSK